MPPSPRPGTLEWLADDRPDDPVLTSPAGALSRAAWEARAEALAEHLARERGAGPGALLTASGRIGPDWFVVSWAAAKLGAGLAGLPPGPGATLPGAIHVEALPAGPAMGPRRLSGAAAPPDSVTFSRAGRPVRRAFPPERVAAVGPVLADLVAHLQAAPGTTLAVSGDVADPVLTFLANVVLVGGGRVVSAPEPAAVLALGAGRGAELAALAPGDLGTLAALPEADREELDLTGLRALVTGGAPLDPAARDAVDDLFGAESVIDVYVTADTGVVAVRGPGAEHHALLDGVEARTSPGGLLEVRSPLAAGSGWTPTGDRAALVGDAGLQLL